MKKIVQKTILMTAIAGIFSVGQTKAQLSDQEYVAVTMDLQGILELLSTMQLVWKLKLLFHGTCMLNQVLNSGFSKLRMVQVQMVPTHCLLKFLKCRVFRQTQLLLH